MKALKSVLKDHRLVTILYLQELALFLAVFIPLTTWFHAASSKTYFGTFFTVDFFPEILAKGSGLLAISTFLILTFLFFFLLRIFLMGGIFDSLIGKYAGFPHFLHESAQHFPRFLILFLVYSIPLLILTAIAGKTTGSIAQNSPNQAMPVTMMLVSRSIAIILSIVFSFWHTNARFKTILNHKTKFSLAIRGKFFLGFAAYQLASVAFLLLFTWLSVQFLTNAGTGLMVAGFLLMQIGLYVRNLLKLASYKLLS
ncbi:MAG: hypothetical protein DRJ08_00780 [Acidobacteria bacterium]|nr:MAG: hypothetical protein DRJ14_00360 [Acidobacteriota bacterium]RLE24513.1 MAG: hypothetical protein DRJ08_00780 [Acidobacteriota bacterium]